MKNARFTLVVAFFAAAWATVAMGDPNSRQRPHRPPLGNNPHPVIWGGQQTKPPLPAPQPPTSRSADHADHGNLHHGFGRSLSHTYIVHGYDPCYSYGYIYPYAYLPAYASTTNLFGPWAAQRFMGLDDGAQLRPNANVVFPVREDEQDDAPERATNAQANALAWRFISFGDARFAERNYVDANERYRKASRSAPQLADAWFRQGLALSASGRYDLAVAAIQRGLKLDPKWPKSGFKLTELYGPAALALDAQFDVLARAARDKPNDANLLFLIGVYLHFDGEPERAEKFFQRAQQLAVGDAEHIRAFLAK